MGTSLEPAFAVVVRMEGSLVESTLLGKVDELGSSLDTSVVVVVSFAGICEVLTMLGGSDVLGNSLVCPVRRDGSSDVSGTPGSRVDLGIVLDSTPVVLVV